MENVKSNKNIENNIKSNGKSINFMSDLKCFFSETARIVIISLIVIFFVRSFIMQPFFVSGKSMEPNFHDGDYIIVDEISYRFKKPKRGDVIVFKYPNNPKEFFIKRVIGLPGEKIELKEGSIKIYNKDNVNGFLLNEMFYIPEETRTYGNKIINLKDDEYYVLGDNRNASADSRVWGALEDQFIIGKAWIRAWPFDKFSVFGQLNYSNNKSNK